MQHKQEKLKHFLYFYYLCIVGRCFDPQELFLVLAHRGGALGSEKKITETVQIAPHLAIHQVVFYQRHHGALRPPADGPGKVEVRRTQTTRLVGKLRDKLMNAYA